MFVFCYTLYVCFCYTLYVCFCYTLYVYFCYTLYVCFCYTLYVVFVNSVCFYTVVELITLQRWYIVQIFITINKHHHSMVTKQSHSIVKNSLFPPSNFKWGQSSMWQITYMPLTWPNIINYRKLYTHFGRSMCLHFIL